jgi:A/G-specific adenine glycosylase
VTEHYQGRIPDQYEALIRLPGIGRSTTGAILSLAYNQPFPILDGNIKRVLIRFFNIRKVPQKAGTLNELWNLSTNLLSEGPPSAQPGPFNEALMEMGALLCTPKDPVCPRCPIRRKCRAYALGDPTSLPLKSPKRKIPHFDVTAAVIRKGKKILITQRPEKGLLGGLWEFPGGKREMGESLAECLIREIREELSLEIEVEEEPFIKVNHAYSHFRITLHCFFGRRLSGRIRLNGVKDYRWVLPSELPAYAFPRADQKVIAYLFNLG